jgi:outer membrane receptor protein involved in Fe transport
VCLFVGLVLLGAVPGFAQTTGTIRGVVTDVNEEPLPGVTVAVTGDALGGAQRTAVTGTTGAFTFPGLQVGDYSVSATLDGFAPQSIDGVDINIDAVATVNFRLPEAFAEEIAVTAESPIVDVTSPSVSSNYDAEFVADLPTKRSFYDIIVQSPGVFQPDESSIFISAFGSDVQWGGWNIDGVNMSSPEGNYLFFNMNPDVIQETQVLGVGAGAEYGSTGGSVYNIVTKSGTNDFHGSLGVHWTEDALLDSNVSLDGTETGEWNYNKWWDATATLGGPLKRDRLWFFGGIQRIEYNITEPREQPGSKLDDTVERIDLKLSFQFSDSHRLDVKGGKDDSIWNYAYDLTVYEPTTWRFFSWVNEQFAAEYNGVLSDRSFLQVRGGYWTGDNLLLPQTPVEDLMLVKYHVWPYEYTGGSFWDYEWVQEHMQGDLVLTHFADDFIAGNHEFKFGVQASEGSGLTTTIKTEYLYTWPSYYYYGYYYTYKWGVNPFQYGSDGESVSAFATDSWQISDRFTLDLGIRYDKHDASFPDMDRLDKDSNPIGEIIPGYDVIDWTNWSPRLGFAWQATGDGRTVVRGSAGIYYNGLVTGNWYSPPPEAPPFQWFWVAPTGEEYMFFEWSPGESLVQPDIKTPKATEYTIGVERQIGDTIAVGAQFVYKDTEDMIGWQFLDDGVVEPFQWTDPDTGQTFDLVDILVAPTRRKGNSTGPGAVGGDRNYSQEYQGFFLTFKKRYSSGWDLMASYTYSEAKGLNTRPYLSSWYGQGGPFWSSTSEGNPNVWGNAEGLLVGDRPHAFRVTGNVQLPWKFRLSYILNHQTGRPYALRRQVQTPSGQGITIISEHYSDDRRMPDQTLLDIGLGRHFALGDWGEFILDLQVLNLLNEDAVTYWQTDVLPAGQDYIEDGWVVPRHLRIRAKIQF